MKISYIKDRSTLRKFADDEREAASIIAWTERRLEVCTNHFMVAYYAKQFQKMWTDSFGTLANVPQDFKDRVSKLHADLKAANG